MVFANIQKKKEGMKEKGVFFGGEIGEAEGKDKKESWGFHREKIVAERSGIKEEKLHN